jgi:hypothetical protein
MFGRIAAKSALFLLAASVGPAPASATEYLTTSVVGVFYGVETVLSPTGAVVSVTDVETAETGLGSFVAPTPAGYIAEFPTLVPQIESDPQSTYANFPSYVLPTLGALANSNGFGSVSNGVVVDPTVANFYTQPGVEAFESQLAANAGGPFVTVANTGFFAPPTPAAFCVYVESLIPGSPCAAQTTPTTFDYFEFTYQLGPYSSGGNSYTSLVNFEFFEDDVTVQQDVPEPPTLALLGIGMAVVGIGMVRRRGAKGVYRGRRKPVAA